MNTAENEAEKRQQQQANQDSSCNVATTTGPSSETECLPEQQRGREGLDCLPPASWNTDKGVAGSDSSHAVGRTSHNNDSPPAESNAQALAPMSSGADTWQEQPCEKSQGPSQITNGSNDSAGGAIGMTGNSHPCGPMTGVACTLSWQGQSFQLEQSLLVQSTTTFQTTTDVRTQQQQGQQLLMSFPACPGLSNPQAYPRPCAVSCTCSTCSIATQQGDLVVCSSQHSSFQNVDPSSGQPGTSTGQVSQSAQAWYLQPEAWVCNAGALPGVCQRCSSGSAGLLCLHPGLPAPLVDMQKSSSKQSPQFQPPWLPPKQDPRAHGHFVRRNREGAAERYKVQKTPPKTEQSRTEEPHAAPAEKAPSNEFLSDPATLVFVWDLDETLIVFNSLLNGKYSKAVKAPSGPQPTATASASDLNSSSSASTPQAMQVAASGSDPSTSTYVQSRNDEAFSRVLRQKGVMTAQDYHVIGDEVADFIFSCCDDLLDYQDVERIDPMNIVDVLMGEEGTHRCKRHRQDGRPSKWLDPDPLASSAYTKAKAFYLAGLSALPPLQRTRALELREKVDKATNGWIQGSIRLMTKLSEATERDTEVHVGKRGSLTSCSETDGQSCAAHSLRHCLVSTGQLLPTLFKLVLFGLNPWFDVEDVFSASNYTKLACFERLSMKLNSELEASGEGESDPPQEASSSSASNSKTLKVMSIGDGQEEKKAAAAMKWPFVQVCLTTPQNSPQENALAEWYEVGHRIVDINYKDLIALAARGLPASKSNFSRYMSSTQKRPG